MTTTVLPGLAVLALLVAGGAVAALRRRLAAERRRAEALTALAERIDAAVDSLASSAESAAARAPAPRPEPASPAPLVADGLPGRAGFVDALTEEVARARAEGSRLAAALVRASGDDDAHVLATGVREAAGASPYAVGTRSVAIVLRGLGRAEALGVLARIEAHRPSSGRAIELEPGEGALDLVVRLLAPAPAGATPHGAS